MEIKYKIEINMSPDYSSNIEPYKWSIMFNNGKEWITKCIGSSNSPYNAWKDATETYSSIQITSKK